MKAIVNNIPTTRWGKDEYHVHGILLSPDASLKISNTLNTLFTDILYSIQISNNETELRQNMNFLVENDSNFNLFFKYGFGSSHMWVKQIDDHGICRSDNMIFVEF